jgi:folylpolyglutamate synthase/dihydropteroate synthase
LEALAPARDGATASVLPTVAEALDRALAEAGENEVVCVTGSLTTVGEARSRLRALDWVR